MLTNPTACPIGPEQKEVKTANPVRQEAALPSGFASSPSPSPYVFVYHHCLNRARVKSSLTTSSDSRLAGPDDAILMWEDATSRLVFHLHTWPASTTSYFWHGVSDLAAAKSRSEDRRSRDISVAGAEDSDDLMLESFAHGWKVFPGGLLMYEEPLHDCSFMSPCIGTLMKLSNDS